MTGEDIAQLARDWIGTPFIDGAATQRQGCDCLGLILGLWAKVTGHNFGPIAPYSVGLRQGAIHAQLLMEIGPRFHPVEPSRPIDAGQILVFALRGAAAGKHLAIASGAHKMVHAYAPHGVVETSLSAAWQARIYTRFCYPVAVHTGAAINNCS